MYAITELSLVYEIDLLDFLVCILPIVGEYSGVPVYVLIIGGVPVVRVENTALLAAEGALTFWRIELWRILHRFKLLKLVNGFLSFFLGPVWGCDEKEAYIIKYGLRVLTYVNWMGLLQYVL